MIKYIKSAIFAVAASSLMVGCGDFGDTNIDPEHLNEGNVPFESVFTNAEHQALGSDWDVWRDGMIYLSQWNQHIAAGGWWWSYGINAYSDDYAASYWGSVLGAGGRGAIRDIQSCIAKWQDDPAKVNEYNMARIVRAYIFQRVSDMHGDIPYTEAGQPNAFQYPKYDTQEFIYNDLLKELDEAQAALTGSVASIGAKDIYYQGDIAKWKKFANSLLLRTAMRLSKVDAAKAAQYAKKAYQQGVITEVADNALLNHPEGAVSNDSAEPYAKIIIHEDPDVPFINNTFLNILKSTNDPRIPLIMAIYPTYPGKDVVPSLGDTNVEPSAQKGLPGFYSMGPTSSYSIKKYFPEEFTDEVLKDTESDKYYQRAYSKVNRLTYGDPKAPTFICTAAQTNLLLAEAAQRGWISGSAENFYKAGVRAAMKQFASYPNAGSLVSQYLTDDAINAYIAANAFDASKALEQINTQYWITCFCDEYETWSNWRRSGYPTLEFSGTKHDNWSSLAQYEGIVRRMPYPSGEAQINPTNYKEAVGRLGLQNENDFNDTRVWWDKK